MSEPLISVTVPLPRPLTGTELIEVVKVVAKLNDTTRFYTEPGDGNDVYRIGQASEYPYAHVLVAPALDNTGVRKDESYDQVVVMRHSWPIGGYNVGYDESDVRKAVQQFAQALELCLAGELHKEKIWPQTVTVCSHCERIVARSGGDIFCPTHGENPPTRKMQVEPVKS